MHKVSVVCGAVIALGLAVGCGKDSTENLVSSFKKKAQDDLASWHATFAAEEKGLINDNTAEGKGFTKIAYVIGNEKYDVRKTDSVVNPYVGELTFSVYVYIYKEQPTRAEAEATKDTETAGDIVKNGSPWDEKVHHHTYHYEKGKGWAFVSGTHLYYKAPLTCSAGEHDDGCPQFGKLR